MPLCRNILHESKYFEFELFLKYKGWKIQEPKGGYEVIRATKDGEKTIVLLQRNRTDHATIGWDMEHAYKLVKEFMRLKKRRRVIWTNVQCF